jgi:hypothetical protein
MHAKKEQKNEQQHHNSILTSGTANRAEIDFNMEIGESAPLCRERLIERQSGS